MSERHDMITCVNLREPFGDRFRVLLEEPAASYADPWCHTMPCRFGQIYPHGGDLLDFASNGRGSVAKRVAALPFTTVTQDGADGVNITFAFEHFDEVAAIVKPRRRRRLSDTQRAAACERLRKYRPTLGQSVKNLARQRSNSTLERTQTARADSGHQVPIAEPKRPSNVRLLPTNACGFSSMPQRRSKTMESST
jgi:hypothetical protein